MKADIDISIVLTPFSVLSNAMGVMDMLTTANYVAQRLPGVSRRFRPVLVSVGGVSIQGSNGIVFSVKNDLPDPKAVNIAIVPSGPPPIWRSQHIAAALAEQTVLTSWLGAVHQAGGTVASCCTGSFLLAAADLLNNRLATTHWRAEHAFRTLFPKVELRIDNLLLEEERILTGGGAQSFSSLVLRLIEKEMGEAVATATAKLMLTNGHTSGQSAYRQWLPHLDHGDAVITRAQSWLQEHYTEAFDLDTFASHMMLTPRTLMRRFKHATGMAPLQYQQRLRIEQAKTQLESSPGALNQIVWQIGYEDVSSFQRLFKRETGLSMLEYRQRFGNKRYELT
jgi:transcriptional regulator GlxA family with amidase domain